MVEIIIKKEALSIWNGWCENSYQLPRLTATETTLRRELESIYNKHSHLIAKGKSFEFDVKYAIELHKLLNTKRMCERTGLEGTNIDLYRAIIKKAMSISKFGSTELRRVMKLNTVKSLVVEPSLFKGGIDGCVNSLFRDLNIK